MHKCWHDNIRIFHSFFLLLLLLFDCLRMLWWIEWSELRDLTESSIECSLFHRTPTLMESLHRWKTEFYTSRSQRFLSQSLKSDELISTEGRAICLCCVMWYRIVDWIAHSVVLPFLLHFLLFFSLLHLCIISFVYLNTDQVVLIFHSFSLFSSIHHFVFRCEERNFNKGKEGIYYLSSIRVFFWNWI